MVCVSFFDYQRPAPYSLAAREVVLTASDDARHVRGTVLGTPGGSGTYTNTAGVGAMQDRQGAQDAGRY
jgi:hypothetical protein